MFLRYTKKNGNADRVYRRAVFLNNSVLVQHGDGIVAFAYLKSSEGSLGRYVIEVASVSNGGAVDCEEVSRYVKRFIGNSKKWESAGFTKRRYETKVVSTLAIDAFSIKRMVSEQT